MNSSTIKLIIRLIIRLFRRAVEWPLPFIFGIMTALLITCLFFLLDPKTGVPVIYAIFKYGFLFPLGIPLDQTEINLNTEQTFRLFGLWYLAYVVVAELISGLMRLFKIKSPLPGQSVTFGLLAVGYTIIAVAMGFGVNESHQFALWPTGMAIVLLMVAAISLALSRLVDVIDTKIQASNFLNQL